MSDTILTGDFTVYYLDENRRKQIRWTGTTAKSDVEKMIDVYDASEDLMTQPTQQNKGLIFSAETPGEYTIGKIDAGDPEPWFIDLKTMEHIVGDYAAFTGCALKTSGWKRVQDSNVGVIVMPVTSGHDIDSADIGDTITDTTNSDTGTLLDVVITGGANDYLFIRPTSFAAANNWDSTGGTIDMTGNAHTATSSGASITGEMVWGNVYSQGALVNDTHVFLFQDGSRVTSSDETDQDFWVDGHIDRNLPITDFTTDNFPVIDDGYLLVKANQYGSKHTYANIRMNSISGGNVSAGLSSGADINNTTGYKSVTFDGTNYVAGWTVGDEMTGDTSNARGIITQIDSAGASQTVHYFLVGDPLTDFDSGGENVSNDDDTGTGATTVAAPAAQGPDLTTWFDGNTKPTYAFTAAQADIDDDGTADEEYAVAITMGASSLAQMHEYNKFTAMRSSILDYDGLDGQEWIGLDYAINYASITGTVAEGAVVTGATSGAIGTVVSNPGGTTNTALLRNTRGTFIDGERIYENDGTDEFDAASLTVEVIVPVAESSFGTLAGTTFFGSRGVLLIGYKGTEENNFSLIDAKGTPRARPTSITMEVLNAKQYDWVSCWRLTGSGGVIDKDEYSATGGEIIGDITVTVDSTINKDVPGKDAGGSIVIQDVTDDKEYVVRYDSFVGSTGVVTLANIDIAAATGGSTTTVSETGAFVNAKVGDLVYNHDLTEVTYVSQVNSDDLITVYPAFSGDPTGDHIELNCSPIAIDTADKVYFAVIFEFQEADGSSEASMQYNAADIFTRVVVRNTSAAATKIKGFTSDVTIGTGGGNASVTRIENTVYGS